MVLQKVGEFQTTINVNGDQKVSTNQSSDKTYNLSESFTTDIQVNGSTQNSFSQTGDSVYDISVSTTPENITEGFSKNIDWLSSNFDTSFTLGSLSQSTVDALSSYSNTSWSWDLTVDSGFGEEDFEWALILDGQQLDSDGYGYGYVDETYSGGGSNINNAVGTYTLDVNDTGGYSDVYIDFDFNLTVTAPISVSIDGVSQS